jgi:general secretion pathway protein G
MRNHRGAGGSLVTATMASGRKRFQDSGFMLIEVIAVMTILLILTTMAIPITRHQIIRAREERLHDDLRTLREAIDRYKYFSDNQMIPAQPDTFGYPPDLKILVEGVKLKGTSKGKYKFLREIPIDPVTGTADWGMRSMQDEADSKSWGGENVFDVYSKAQGIAMDGTQYGDW